MSETKAKQQLWLWPGPGGWPGLARPEQALAMALSMARA